MAILTAREISKSTASRTLFEALSFTVQEAERIALIGPNGAGKSTLLRILAEEETSDQGSVNRRKNAVIGYLPQVDLFDEAATVERTLLDALTDRSLEAHEPRVRTRKMLRRLGFTDHEAQISTLSGGWKKRAALGRLLVQQPDCVLMDEPTNHLDLEGIAWLERFLERAEFSFIITSHDRYFLERVADRVIEIDPRYPRGVLDVRGKYSDFLEQREAVLLSLDRRHAALAHEVRREVQWLRSGPKARSSKAGYRIDEAYRRIDQLSAQATRTQEDPVKSLTFNASGRRTNDLIVADSVTIALGGRCLFSSVDVHVLRGTRLGIVGNNASGKTTLLKILTGEIKPDRGRVRTAPDLRLAVFDQHRDQLDPHESLRRALAPMGDIVTVPGRPTHVIPWAKRFGFEAEQLTMPLSALSGGEQARVLMAMMMRSPADVLFLDEPTNDLDIPSIEVLEHGLLSFPGAVVLITHDRHMLDRVCTEIIGLHRDGGWGMYANVGQWLDADQHRVTAGSDPLTPEGHVQPRSLPRRQSPRGGLTYHEKRELEGIEPAILLAEDALREIEQKLEYANEAADHARLETLFLDREQAALRVKQLYARWEALEAKASS